jgi:hypothetical protein
MSVELRRLIIDPQLDPQIARIGTVVNRLVDMANGNGAGRIWLLQDDGNKKATSGSSGVLPGAVLSANNYPLRVEPTSTNQVNVLHSNGATVGLRVQDGGLTTGVPATLTSTLAVTGATTLTGALAANGGTTTTTLTASGATLLNGAVTLGDAAADVITVTGTMTVAEILTLVKGLVVDTTSLVVDAVNNKVGILTATPTAPLTVAGNIQVTSAVVPSAGAGLELSYTTGTSTANLVAFDRTGVAYKNLNIDALTTQLKVGGTALIKMDATGLGFFGTAGTAQPAGRTSQHRP